MQGVDERERTVLQEQLDFLKGDAEELERRDLFQAFQVFHAIEAKTGVSALRLEQTDAVVVVQGANGYAGQFREFADAVSAGHFFWALETIVEPDARSRSRGEWASCLSRRCVSSAPLSVGWRFRPAVLRCISAEPVESL